MRTMAYMIASSTGVIATAEVTPVPTWIQGSALAVLAGVLMLLIVRVVPAILKHEKEERVTYLAALRNERDASREEQEASREERKQYRDSIDRFGEHLGRLGEQIARCPHKPE
jgi:membrane protein implicated in regulation of membrane protease activity